MIETKFKQTELGPIPEDWNIYTLGTVSDIKTGPFGSALHASDYVRFGTPIITVEHLGEPYIIHALNIPLVGVEDKKRLSQYTLRTGDIVYSRVGSVDRNSVVTEKEDGWLFSGRLLRVRNSGNYYAPYLGYHLNSNNAKKRIVSSAVGLGMPSINTKILGEHVILLPNNIDEQKRIAEALSDVDDLILELDALIEKKRAIFQGSMQELLTGRRRLPGFNESWREVAFKDLGYTYNGLSGKTGVDFGHGDSKFIMFVNVIYKDTVSPLYFGTVDISNSEKQNKVQQNDLIFNTSSETPEEVGMCTCVSEGYQNLYLNSFCFGFRFHESNVNARFITFMLRSKIGRKLMMELAQGSTRYNLPKRRFLSSTINLPKDKREQDEIALILSDMTKEIEELEAKRKKYAAIRQGMMQQLLTGKIRLI